MSYKTILVQCDAGEGASHRLDVAVEFARRFHAHVVGLYTHPQFAAPTPFDGGLSLGRYHLAFEESAKADHAHAVAAFDKATKGMDISSEFRAVSGYADLQLVASANCADLVVVGQADPGRTRAMATPSNLAEQVALHAACPVMVVPHVGVQSAPGKTVLLCWKQTREAARAVTAALPILKTATKVMALAIGTGKSPARDPEPGTELVHWLGRHGVTVSVRHEQAVDDDIGAMILSDAADHGADLIVMGAYGHSRLRELVLGGVSRTLFGSMTVPLLVAH